MNAIEVLEVSHARASDEEMFMNSIQILWKA